MTRRYEVVYIFDSALEEPRGITVDQNDLVGIGTTHPGKKLTVAGDMELGTASFDYTHLRIGGGNSDGFLYGSFLRFGDGIHMGYNFFADADGNDQVIHTDRGTSRISMGEGIIQLATAGPNGAPPVITTLSPRRASLNFFATELTADTVSSNDAG